MNLEDSQLGKYQIHAEIGRGDLGTVYRGFDPDAARAVAIKVLAPYLSLENETVDHFLDTARTAARLNHPNIVNIYDIGTHDGWFYFVMEQLEGQSLDQFLADQGPLPSDAALSLLGQMADALDHAHAQGLLHRGVKPSNVVIDADGHAKLTDFGLARLSRDRSTKADGNTTDALQYLSPEQASGQDFGPPSDHYSLAVVAYEMLSGVLPFYADTRLESKHESPSPITLYRPDLPRAVDEVFSRALAHQPERRYWSATTFVTSLSEALADQSPSEAVAPPPVQPADHVPPARPPSRRLTMGRFTGAALVLILLLVTALAVPGVIRQPGDSQKPPIAVAATQTPATPIARYTPEISTYTPLPEPTEEATATKAPPLSDEPGSILTVQVPVADVRANPSRGSELVTQVIIGEKVVIRDKQDGWYQISAVDQPSPKDPEGYPGWIQTEVVSLQPYELAQIAIVMVPEAPLRSTPSVDGGIVHKLYLDSRLAFQSANDSWVAVTLPDEKGGWLSRDHVRLVCPDGQCSDGVVGQPDEPRPVEEILATAKQFIGTPYLWGGTNSTAFDCSGFVYRVMHANGITVPRDSQPMSQSGTWVEKQDLRPGDVIFTARGGRSGRVSHCAIYVGDGNIITPVDSAPFAIVPLDAPRYRDNYWGARRYP